MKYLYIFLLLLSSNILLGQNHTEDSIKIELKKQISPENRVKLLLKLADLKLEKFDGNSKILIDSAYQIAKSLENKYLIADCYYQFGRYWKYFDDYEKAINKLLNASNIYIELKKDYEIAETYRFLGETFRGALNYQFAIHNLNKASLLFTKINSQYGMSRTNNRFAAVYFELMYQDSNYVLYFDSIKKYFHLSQKIAVDSNWSDLIVSNLNIYGATFAHLSQLDSSQKYLFLAKEFAEKNDLKVDIPMILTHLGNIEKQRKNYQKALEYGYEAYYLGKSYNSSQYSQFSAKLLAETYHLLGNLDSAMHFIKIQYSDYYVIFNSMVQTKMLNAEYKIKEEKDLELKERDEKLLFYQMLIFTIITILLITTTIFLVLRSRNIKKANMVLEEKNLLITEQREKLLELNKTKDKFFAIISHDLKNPIGAFKNSLNLAENIFDDFTTEELKELITELSNSAQTVYDMLEDLLSWTRIQQDRIKFDPSQNDIYYLIDKIIYFLNDTAKQKNITLESKIKTGTIINSDIFLIHTVLRNLISNAIKFTNSGGRVIVDFESTTEKNIIIVEDNGVGIDPSKIDKLFRIDENVSTHGTLGEKGTGMGLVLCNEFVEKHQGKLEITSSINKGTKIKIILPKEYKLENLL